MIIKQWPILLFEFKHSRCCVFAQLLLLLMSVNAVFMSVGRDVYLLAMFVCMQVLNGQFCERSVKQYF